MKTGQRIAAAALFALLVAACAADEDVTPADEAQQDADVTVGATDLGDVLVDAEGMTLYIFDNDDGAGVSTCDGQCAESWPPLLVDGEPTGAGVEADLLGTTARDGGGRQVTYDGWPLYRWSGDAEPGDTNGQGFGGVWWAFGAGGEPLRDTGRL